MEPGRGRGRGRVRGRGRGLRRSSRAAVLVDTAPHPEKGRDSGRHVPFSNEARSVPFLIQNGAYNLFVVETFLKVKSCFPRWYHNDLLTNLSGVYCPYNWPHLSPAERASYRQRSTDVAIACTQRKVVEAVLNEDKVECIDITNKVGGKVGLHQEKGKEEEGTSRPMMDTGGPAEELSPREAPEVKDPPAETSSLPSLVGEDVMVTSPADEGKSSGAKQGEDSIRSGAGGVSM